ncbi:MAG TPA: hypothetical protein VKB38_09130 [Terracidiphilus sp.]|nr:hypothetical protein [Terracidiphilus sp.]
MTSEISTCGVYLTTRTAVPVGSRVQLEIEVSLFSAQAREMRLQGEGTVVRVEKVCRDAVKPSWGIAASVHFYQENSRELLLTVAQNSPASQAEEPSGKGPIHARPVLVSRTEKRQGLETEAQCGLS